MSKKIVTFGEILLRLSPPHYFTIAKTNRFNAFYGGAEANVGVSLSIFGQKVQFVTLVPDNELGEAAIGELRYHGVEPIVTRQGERLGIYYFEPGASERPSKVVYDRSGSSFSKFKKGSIPWEEIFKNADWFHWSGITPSLSQDLADLSEEALIVASKMG